MWGRGKKNLPNKREEEERRKTEQFKHIKIA